MALGCPIAVALVIFSFSAYCESSADKETLSSSPSKSESAATSKGKQICEFGLTSCPANKQCVPKNSRTKSGTCECLDGYELTEDGECVRLTEKEQPVLADKVTCEFGVEFCDTNEVCKPKNSRSKMGLCVCVDGYQRNQDKVCEAINSSSTVSTEVQTTVTPKPSNQTSLDVQLAAIAGPDITVSTPETLVVIEGGAKSRGDNVKYSWRVAESSPASGRILNGSEHHRTLLFVPFITGTYEFTLTVVDESGSTAHDSVRVTVNDAVGRYAIAMRLSSGANRFSFSEADRRALETQIELLLNKPSSAANLRAEVTIDTLKEQPFDSSKTLEFNVRFVPLDNDSPAATVSHNYMWTDVANDIGMPPFRVGDPRWVSNYLEEKLEEQRGRLLDFDILNVDPKYCVDPVTNSLKNTTKRTRCGAHASCVDDRKCVCDTLWLANPMHHLRTHCDINLFALILIPAIALLALLGLIAFCIRLCCSPRRSLHDRVRERLEQRERQSREAKRLISTQGAKTRSRNAKAILSNVFDSDDNYGAETDGDDNTGTAKLHSGNSLNKLTDAHDELHDAELTPFVCDNVNVNVRSMNVNSDKSGSKVKA